MLSMPSLQDFATKIRKGETPLNPFSWIRRSAQELEIGLLTRSYFIPESILSKSLIAWMKIRSKGCMKRCNTYAKPQWESTVMRRSFLKVGCSSIVGWALFVCGQASSYLLSVREKGSGLGFEIGKMTPGVAADC